MSGELQLTQHWLGMRPYVLIEADKDPADGELVLKIKAGGLPDADAIGTLPMLMLTELPTESNPLTSCIAEYLVDFPGHRDVLASFAATLGVPMPEATDG